MTWRKVFVKGYNMILVPTFQESDYMNVVSNECGFMTLKPQRKWCGFRVFTQTQLQCLSHADLVPRYSSLTNGIWEKHTTILFLWAWWKIWCNFRGRMRKLNSFLNKKFEAKVSETLRVLIGNWSWKNTYSSDILDHFMLEIEKVRSSGKNFPH